MIKNIRTNAFTLIKYWPFSFLLILTVSVAISTFFDYSYNPPKASIVICLLVTMWVGYLRLTYPKQN